MEILFTLFESIPFSLEPGIITIWMSDIGCDECYYENKDYFWLNNLFIHPEMTFMCTVCFQGDFGKDTFFLWHCHKYCRLEAWPSKL